KPVATEVARADIAAPLPSHESPNAATATAGGEQPQPPVKDNGPVIPAATAAALVSGFGSRPSAPAPEPPVKAAPPQADPRCPSREAITGDAPAITEVKTSHGVVKLADLRIDSRPQGATVMLVDNGKTSFLGTTPVAASLDPSRAYDVIFTLEGHPA